MFHLQVVNGPHQGQECTLVDSAITLGRAMHCHLVLSKDHVVSRTHGELATTGQTTWYTDLQSHNGSRVRKRNGNLYTLSPLFSRCEIEPGDLIFVGNSVVELVTTGDSSHCFDPDVTMIPTATGVIDQPLRSENVKVDESSTADSLRQFLQLPRFDLTDIGTAKHALSRAYLSVFSRASATALVEVRRIRDGTGFERSHIRDNETVVARRNESSPNGYSYTVMLEAYQRRGMVSMRSPTQLPSSESLTSQSISSCLCAPIFDGPSVIGFVQVMGHEEAAFGSRDLEIFGILTSVTSLLLRQARVAAERVKTRRLASVGQAVAALSHDVKSILGSVGSFASLLEDEIPSLSENRKWRYIRQDLELMKFLVKDTRIRLSGTESLKPTIVRLSDEVQPILDACQRYFINEVDQSRIVLNNQCDPDATVFVHPDALWVALMNCIKNAIDAYMTTSEKSTPSLCPIDIFSENDPERPDDYCLISVCDQASGIPKEILTGIGRELVSTKGEKGTGLGFQIVVDTVKRLNGCVVIATSTKPINSLPAGTIICLRLPKHDAINTPPKFGDSPFVVKDPSELFNHHFRRKRD